jgi:glycerol-3-phosphate dehydrogenase
VGTTDTPLSQSTLEPRALPQEKEFIMEHTARYLSKAPAPSDVRSIFAGLRPLVKSGDAGNTANLSRDHTILVSESGLLTVTGGKWTTYRKMAHDVIDQAEIIAGVDSRPCTSEHLPIHGSTREAIAEENLQVYGSDAGAISHLMTENERWQERLTPELPYQAAEVVWQARHEMARSVEDVLARRTQMLLLDARASIEAAPKVAHLLACELGQDAEWEAKQVAAYRALAAGYIFE